jgi:hypothetical protein
MLTPNLPQVMKNKDISKSTNCNFCGYGLVTRPTNLSSDTEINEDNDDDDQDDGNCKYKLVHIPFNPDSHLVDATYRQYQRRSTSSSAQHGRS